MNSLCITGYLPVDLGLVESILSQAGMQPALPAQRDATMSISVWHQQVSALIAQNDYDDIDEAGGSANLGRLWEQLASDIFISNLHSPIWGWADTRSSSLLTFWKNFDPQLRFVLVVCSPERLIAHAIEDSDDTPDVESILEQWHSHYQSLLKFHQANPKRSILVNVQDCIDQPAAFLQTLNKKWKLQLNKVHFPNIAQVGFSDLTRYLAAGLVRTSKNHKELNDKVSLSVSLSPSGIRQNSIPSHSELMRWYRKMRGDLAQSAVDQIEAQEKHKQLTEKINEERATINELAAQTFALERKQREQTFEIERLLADISRLQKTILDHEVKAERYKEIELQLAQSIKDCDAQKSQLDEAVRQRSAVEGKLAETKAALDKALKDRDAQKSQFDEAVRQRSAVEGKLAETKAALDNALKDRDAQKSQLDEAVRQRAAVDSKLAESKAAHDIAIKERDAQKSQLEEAVRQRAGVDSKLAETKVALDDAIKERDSQLKIAADASAKLNALRTQSQSLADQEKDLKEENDLLILQLHQVQEELETYFLKYQDASKEVETGHARWRRMLVRNPDYSDYEAIEIEPVESDKMYRTNWKIKGMDAGGRHIPEIIFSTFIEKGVAGIEFSRDDLGNAGLLRWPTTLSADKILTIAMLGDAKTSEKRALALIGLATSDWTLLNVLIGLMRKGLSNPLGSKVSGNFDATALIKALDKLETNLKAIPEVVRYDKVKLKREQVNHDYEHLWFVFENMKTSGKLIGDFEYRISCANVRPKKFGDHPKLEFPEETCKTVIQSWFDESYDDYGAKLELRFALPESMDMEVWGKLTPDDQMFIRDLVRQLPDVMEDLRLNGNTPKRGWDDWKALTSETHRVLTMRADTPKPSSNTRKANPRKSAV